MIFVDDLIRVAAPVKAWNTKAVDETTDIDTGLIGWATAVTTERITGCWRTKDGKYEITLPVDAWIPVDRREVYPAEPSHD